MEYDIEYLAEGGIYNALIKSANTEEEVISSVIENEKRVIGKLLILPVTKNEKRNFKLLHTYRFY